MKQFDPDKPYVKKRGMTGVYYEQDGAKFSSGYKFMEELESQSKPEKPAKKKDDVRKRAAAKIAAKRGKEDDPLDGFRGASTPEAVSSAAKENEAARRAEENAE